MTLELTDLKLKFDKAYNAGRVTRERGSDDLVFYMVTHWDDQLLEETQLAYRGQFDILKKAGRQVMSDLAANPVQVDFQPLNETRDDAAEIADGLYRSDDNNNRSIESYEVAKNETVVCGVGAWMLFTEYESKITENRNQVIRRRPIFEANNTVFWDPNAKSLDKSDAMYCAVLTAYSEDAYIDLVYELTGEELDSVSMESFKHPEISYTFPWFGGEAKKIYVVDFFYREKVTEKIITLVDPLGISTTVRESEMVDVMDEMLDAGFEIESEKEIETYQVTKYIASGAQILSEEIIAGENIPVVPCFGEHSYVEGEEHWEGIVRLAKDPQRLRNFAMSYIGDIVSRSPRRKPIFLQEQIAGFEDMYSESGIDNNYPYLLQNKTDANGQDLPIGAVGEMPEQTVPVSVLQTLDYTRQAVEDVANPGVPQDIADPDLSGKAVIALQNRLDMQSMVYQDHFKHAKRRDAEIYISMAKEIYDVPRKVVMTLPDGTRKEAEIMQTIYDNESGTLVTINDINNAEFEVYSEIGPSYSTQKEQTVEQLVTMMQGMQPGDPMRNVLQNKILVLMPGVDFDDVRDYANMQLVLQGIRKPETPEEEQALAAAQQQGQQPSAEMVLAMAEDKKGQADLLREQREGIKMQLEYQQKNTESNIKSFDAETKRLAVQVDAQEAGANIRNKEVDTFDKAVDTQIKLQQKNIAEMTDAELFKELAG